LKRSGYFGVEEIGGTQDCPASSPVLMLAASICTSTSVLDAVHQFTLPVNHRNGRAHSKSWRTEKLMREGGSIFQFARFTLCLVFPAAKAGPDCNF
jgi:hypothetical protein